MLSFGSSVKIGLLFGNERTGLTSRARSANFLWTIPQVSRQPSYNLASAVLISLFEIFRRLRRPPADFESNLGDAPARKQQEECIRLS